MANTRYQTAQALKALGLKDTQQVSRAERWVLAPSSSVFLTFPQVGVLLEHDMPRLRNALALPWLEAIASHFQQVQMAQFESNPMMDLTYARAAGYDLLLELQVLSSDDQLSSLQEWWREGGIPSKSPRSRGRDQLIVAVHVIDVRSGRRLDTLISQAKSGVWSWHERLPAELIDGVVASLTGRISGPRYTSIQ